MLPPSEVLFFLLSAWDIAFCRPSAGHPKDYLGLCSIQHVIVRGPMLGVMWHGTGEACVDSHRVVSLLVSAVLHSLGYNGLGVLWQVACLSLVDL